MHIDPDLHYSLSISNELNLGDLIGVIANNIELNVVKHVDMIQGKKPRRLNWEGGQICLRGPFIEGTLSSVAMAVVANLDS